mmetsp:Transcript_1033/g.1002  ORF Transcript_1033/g.1002 Transcript_1033/m.1002 type:complete len:148 (+) Transcript_1033:2-445(+)
MMIGLSFQSTIASHMFLEKNNKYGMRTNAHSKIKNRNTKLRMLKEMKAVSTEFGHSSSGYLFSSNNKKLRNRDKAQLIRKEINSKENSTKTGKMNTVSTGLDTRFTNEKILEFVPNYKENYEENNFGYSQKFSPLVFLSKHSTKLTH